MKSKWLWLIIAGLSCVPVKAAFSEENLTIGADLRYRHELIDAEGNDMRNRHRIRARINLNARVHEDVAIGIRLSSGSDDPISRNQTLTGGFSSKQINIEEAFFEWNPRTVQGLTVHGGKMQNPLFVPGDTELLWDSDLKPEGLALGYSKSGGPVTLFAHAAYFWVDERKADNDAILLGSQAGITYRSAAAEITFGAGYFDYRNARKHPSFYDTADSFGNSVDGNGNYRYGYRDIELFGEIKPAGLGGNVTVFGDYVDNIAQHVDDDRGWLAGFTLGKCKKPGSFDFRYSYRHLEKDAVVGAFTDSDFIGGGTDGEGHEINVNYQVAPKIKAGVTCFFNRQGIDKGRDYRRFQADMNFKL
ncbi:putative porin [bacterium]|nr:putative porin [bacterium]